MLSFSAIVPHPPIIIPGIGRKDDLWKAQRTIAAIKKLKVELKDVRPDTIVIVSPHAPIDYNSFLINSSNPLEGNFRNFNFDQELSFENNIELAKEISKEGVRKNVAVRFFDNLVDHGALVPLFYLAQEIRNVRVVHLSFSSLNYKSHFNYGKMIGKICGKSPEKIALIASADLSHRLTVNAPEGFSPCGKEFDQQLVNLLNKGDSDNILNMEKDLIRGAKECGLRSIIMLLGMLDDSKYKFKELSYEGPFGVGHLVGEFVFS